MVFLFRVQTFDWWLVGERESDESSAAVECSVSASGVETFRTSAGPTLHCQLSSIRLHSSDALYWPSQVDRDHFSRE